ncbi:UNVERIFIED_CONTAM: hypothetical protein NCL1_50244 [Trichonephila clavipes]
MARLGRNYSWFQNCPACSECNDDRPHLTGCHSGTTCSMCGIWLTDELQPVNPLPPVYWNFGGHKLDEWCNIPQDEIDNLILSMPRRCKACIASSGRHTPY